MAQAIIPKFDFTWEDPRVGTGKVHDSTTEIKDALRPELFNEYERVMELLSAAVGDLGFTDIGNDPQGGPITDISTAIQVMKSQQTAGITTNTLTVNGAANLGAIKVQWKNNVRYYEDNIVIADGKLYKCKQEHQSTQSGLFINDQAYWTMIGGGGGTTKDLHLVNHGFKVGQVLCFNDTYIKAKANSHTTTGLFLVSNWVDSDNFTVTQTGYFKVPDDKPSLSDALESGASTFTPNTWYYLSETTAGKLTSVEPSISNPILYAISATEAYVVGYRPQNATRSNVFEFTYESGQSNYAIGFTPDAYAGSILTMSGDVQRNADYSFSGKILHLNKTYTNGTLGRLFYFYSYPSKASTAIKPYQFTTSGDTSIFVLEDEPAAKEYTEVFVDGIRYWDYNVIGNQIVTYIPITDGKDVRINDIRTINVDVEMSLSENADVTHKSMTLQQDDGVLSKNGVKIGDWRIYENISDSLVIAADVPSADTSKCTINTSGDLTANRVFNAVWNDVAECMPSDGSLLPGFMAQIDKSSDTYRLTKYDGDFESFIGIVSKDPGFIVGMNEEYEKPIYIALRGMVYTRALGVHPVGTMLYLTPGGVKTRTELKYKFSHYDTYYLGKVIESYPDRIRIFI